MKISGCHVKACDASISWSLSKNEQLIIAHVSWKSPTDVLTKITKRSRCDLEHIC